MSLFIWEQGKPLQENLKSFFHIYCFEFFPSGRYKIWNYKNIFVEVLNSNGLIILKDPCKFQARHLEFDTNACLVMQVTFFFKSASRIFKPPYNYRNNNIKSFFCFARVLFMILPAMPRRTLCSTPHCWKFSLKYGKFCMVSIPKCKVFSKKLVKSYFFWWTCFMFWWLAAQLSQPIRNLQIS